MQLKEIELAEVCERLPCIQEYNSQSESSDKPDDIFICSCGFEDRSLAIPSQRSSCGRYRTNLSVVIEHETNLEDNAVNRPILSKYLDSISSRSVRLPFRQQNFVNMFEPILESVTNGDVIPSVSFDISGCSSQMVLSTLKLLFKKKIRLKLLYAEAAVYHPTREEYLHPENWIVDGKGLSKGILRATESRLCPGRNVRELPILLVAFPTFKPERIRSIQTELQPTKTIWILGVPHSSVNSWRKDVMREINQISSEDETYELSTFEYIDTFARLEQIYRDKELTHHIKVAPHGSKMQNVGLALFCLLREDVGFWFSVPESFNPSQYTGGVDKTWMIDFGDVQRLIQNIRSCGKLELIP